jgi:hypothetical protein
LHQRITTKNKRKLILSKKNYYSPCSLDSSLLIENLMCQDPSINPSQPHKWRASISHFNHPTFEFWIASRLGWYLQLYPQNLKSLDRPLNSLDRMSLDRFLLLPCVARSNVARSIFLQLMNFDRSIMKSINRFPLADFPNGRGKLELWKWWKSSLMYFQV